MNRTHPKRKRWYHEIDWYPVVGTTAMIGAVIAFVAFISYTFVRDNEWKDDCHARGGLVVETHHEGEACVDSERRIIK